MLSAHDEDFPGRVTAVVAIIPKPPANGAFPGTASQLPTADEPEPQTAWSLASDEKLTWRIGVKAPPVDGGVEVPASAAVTPPSTGAKTPLRLVEGEKSPVSDEPTPAS